ncbi:MAG: 2-polyprenyl-3-methyl-5-hydroxy-6-metoxy-1,4-benzoquinol methylase, partial [bacterium]
MNSDISKTIQFCRICQNKNLTEILALGKQPPANSLRKDLDENLPEIPLTIKHCDNCKTIQLSDTVNSEYLFRDYVWVTGTSKTAHQHSRFFYEEMVKRSNAEKLFVVEVASNDGTFLIPFQENGHQVLGVDPANNIAEMANEKGIQTISDFFGEKVSQKIVETEGKADVVFARNVIPHVENVHDVIKGMANTVKDDGIVTI